MAEMAIGIFDYLIELAASNAGELAAPGGNFLFSQLMSKYSDGADNPNNTLVRNFNGVASAYWGMQWSPLQGFSKGADPMAQFSSYMNNGLPRIQPISKWCPIPKTGNEMLDEVYKVYWEETYLNVQNVQGTAQGDIMSQFSDFNSYFSAAFKKDAKGMYQRQKLYDSQGKEIVLWGNYGLKSMDKPASQALMTAMKNFYVEVNETIADPEQHFDVEYLLQNDAVNFTKLIGETFNNQMNTISDLMFMDNSYVGTGSSYRSPFVNLKFFWNILGDQQDGINMIEDLGQIWETSMPEIGLDGIFNMDYLPYYAEGIFAQLPNATDPNQQRYLSWWYANKDDPGMAGLGPDQLWDIYSKLPGNEAHANDRPIAVRDPGNPFAPPEEEPPEEEPPVEVPPEGEPTDPIAPNLPPAPPDRFFGAVYQDQQVPAAFYNNVMDQMRNNVQRGYQNVSNLDAIYEQIAGDDDEAMAELEAGGHFDLQNEHETLADDIV